MNELFGIGATPSAREDVIEAIQPFNLPSGYGFSTYRQRGAIDRYFLT
jgi:hypothetical protein